MTKSEIVKQEYKNLLETIYNSVKSDKSDENVITLFKKGSEIVTKYIYSIYDKYVTERGKLGYSEEEFFEEYRRNGEMPNRPLDEYELKVFNYFKDDYSKKTGFDSTSGRKELIKLITNFAKKVYEANPKNKYAQVIAGSLSNIKELSLENDFEELYSQFPQKDNISEFIKEYKNNKNLHNLNLNLNDYTKEQLKALVGIIDSNISSEKNIITANTPEKRFSRDYYGGEAYWDDNTPALTGDQYERIKNASEKIKKYNEIKDEIANKIKKIKIREAEEKQEITMEK